MAFYETIFIIRQDVASADVDKIAEDFGNLVKEYKGDILKREYWGLRSLAYEINNNKKGHYYFLGIQANNDLLAELDRKIKLSESIVRYSLVKVDDIAQDPSPLLRKESDEVEEIVDVTVSKD